jgi:ABC-type phosphate transport system substrate-binding protein
VRPPLALVLMALVLMALGCAEQTGPPPLSPVLEPSALAATLAGSETATPLISRLARMFNVRSPGTAVMVEPPLGAVGGLRAAQAGRLGGALLALQEGAAPPEGARIVAWTRPTLVVGPGARRRRLQGRQLADVLEGRPARWPSGVPIRLILRPREHPLQRAFVAGRPDLGAAFQSAADRRRWDVASRGDELRAALARTPGAIAITDVGTLSLLGAPLWRVEVPGPPPQRVGLYVLPGPHAPPGVSAFVDFATGEEGRGLVVDFGFEAP